LVASSIGQLPAVDHQVAGVEQRARGRELGVDDELEGAVLEHRRVAGDPRGAEADRQADRHALGDF
jgi:hypothetical protein